MENESISVGGAEIAKRRECLERRLGNGSEITNHQLVSDLIPGMPSTGVCRTASASELIPASCLRG